MSRTQRKKNLPIGVDLFETVVEQDYYYVDKTLLIKKIVENKGAVNLFTRPRRFGKTLNMSMLKAFFEVGTDPSVFDGLAISREREVCEAYQGRYPVVFLSLRSVEGKCFEDALEWLRILISDECKRHLPEGKTHDLAGDDGVLLEKYRSRAETEVELSASLAGCMRLLHIYYGRKVILLIDEYDVPLDKANDNGYYQEMVRFLRGFLGQALKTNPDLYFAVLTGCLRISKESIFTGINNLKTDTIADDRFDEFFGFTDEEVREMLAYYGLSDAYEGMREWYDGYRFGSRDVYCPWDVICHCDRLRQNPKAEPKAYWNNTSSNQMVRRFVDLADATTRMDIERLIAGGSVCKEIVEDLTYGELDESREYLWSILYLTGYLTRARGTSESEDGKMCLVIPNREIREIFVEKVRKWFAEKTSVSDRDGLCGLIWNADAEGLQERLHDILLDTISYHDYHENYYHALLVGLLSGGKYPVRSNYEMGTGRSDIVMEDAHNRRAAIVETKRSADFEELDADARKALGQIEERQYAWPYRQRKYSVIACGISFFGKDCCVRAEQILSEPDETTR